MFIFHFICIRTYECYWNKINAELVAAETMSLNQHRDEHEHLQQAGKVRKQTWIVCYSAFDEIRAVGTDFTDMWNTAGIVWV